MNTRANPDANTPAHVVHIIAASFRPEVPDDLAAATLARARALREAPGARAGLVAHTGPSVIVATWLDGRASLEPFAASPPHMEFVMRGLAPSISGMWSAGVETAAPPPSSDDPAETPALLWAFAVRTADTAFEWQVRDVLTSLEALPALVAAGPTFEERDRYRAGGVACVHAADVEAFRTALDGVRAEWGEMRPHIVESTAEVIR
ncbi:MAG: hypothetical protein M0R75_12125 [Dehalococcoidia bacterium]|nr:hypothetical protein [Dehalococcoidia bacterium]